MKFATAMKTDDVCSISATASITIIDDTNDQPDFEFFDEEEGSKKCKLAPTSASQALVLHSKRIHAFVGPSKLYMVMKGMKLQNFVVATVKFIGSVPRLDISMYLSRRPKVTKKKFFQN